MSIRHYDRSRNRKAPASRLLIRSAGNVWFTAAGNSLHHRLANDAARDARGGQHISGPSLIWYQPVMKSSALIGGFQRCEKLWLSGVG